MLTEEAMQERRWGAFPALRKLLEAKPPSNSRYGPLSTSENIFGHLQRLLEIADLANDHSEELLQVSTDSRELGERVAGDILHLRLELESVTHAFGRDIEALSRLSAQLHERSKKVESGS